MYAYRFKKNPEFDRHIVLLSPSISRAVDHCRCECARTRLSYVLVFLSRSCVLIMTVYKWSLTGTMPASLAKQSNIWGLVCLITVDFIFIFSTSFWRTKSYNIFLTTHFAGYVLLIPSVSCECLHVDPLLNVEPKLDLQTLPPDTPFHHRSPGAVWPGLCIPLLQITLRHRHHPAHALALLDADRGPLTQLWLARGPTRPDPDLLLLTRVARVDRVAPLHHRQRTRHIEQTGPHRRRGGSHPDLQKCRRVDAQALRYGQEERVHRGGHCRRRRYRKDCGRHD